MLAGSESILWQSLHGMAPLTLSIPAIGELFFKVGGFFYICIEFKRLHLPQT